MTKQTAILDLLDTTRGAETPGANVERFAIPVLLVIGSTEDIRAGTVLINSAVRLPPSVHFASKQYGPWKLLTTTAGFAVERTLSELGWHFFFMVQGIRAAGVSLTPQGALTKALKKLTARRRNCKASMYWRSWKSHANASCGCTTQGPPLIRGMPNPARSFASSIVIMPRGMFGISSRFFGGELRSAARPRGSDAKVQEVSHESFRRRTSW